MADQEQKVNPEGADTNTRRTVRLRPAVGHTPVPLTPSAPAQENAAPVADPLSGRNTNTGNLAVLDGTQTRRTVKLKPIAPTPVAAHQPIKLNVAAPAAAPVAPAVEAAPVPVAAPVATPVADSGADTRTRKTVRLAPAMPTSKESDDATVRIARPTMAKPAAAPAPAPAPAPAAVSDASRETMVLPQTAPAGASAPEAAPGKATVKLNVPPPILKKAVAPAPAAVKALAPAPAPAAVKAPAPAPDPAEVKAPAPEVAPAKVEAPVSGDSVALTRTYLAIAVITLIMVAAGATLTTVQYLNFWQDQNIELPLVSNGK